MWVSHFHWHIPVELKKLFQDTSIDAEVVLLNSAKEGIDALRKKKIDAFASDQVVLIGLALKEHDPMNFVIKSDVFSFEPFALAVGEMTQIFVLLQIA